MAWRWKKRNHYRNHYGPAKPTADGHGHGHGRGHAKQVNMTTEGGGGHDCAKVLESEPHLPMQGLNGRDRDLIVEELTSLRNRIEVELGSRVLVFSLFHFLLLLLLRTSSDLFENFPQSFPRNWSSRTQDWRRIWRIARVRRSTSLSLSL